MPQHDPTKRRQTEGNMPQSLRIQPEVMALAAVIAKEQGEGQVASLLRDTLLRLKASQLLSVPVQKTFSTVQFLPSSYTDKQARPVCQWAVPSQPTTGEQ